MARPLLRGLAWGLLAPPLAYTGYYRYPYPPYDGPWGYVPFGRRGRRRRGSEEEDIKVEKRSKKSPSFLQIPEDDKELEYLKPWYLEHRHKMVAFRRVGQHDAHELECEKGDYPISEELPLENLRGIGYLWRSQSSKKLKVDLSELEPIELHGLHPCVGSILFRPDILEVMYLIDKKEEAKKALEKCSTVYMTTCPYPIGCTKVYECCVGNNHRAVTLLYFIEESQSPS